MSTSCDADLIILGGGCAGLSLAQRLAEKSRDIGVLVLESREDYHHDRTWCFWAEADHCNAHLVKHHWEAWQFSAAGHETVQRSEDGTTYQCISADDFYRHAVKTIERSDRIALKLKTRVNGVSETDTHVAVDTCKGELRSRWVVDTRPPTRGSRRPEMLNQVFVGIELRTEYDTFDPSVVGLMTNMKVDDLGFRFTYVLPFSARRALVEETRFTREAVSHTRLHSDLDATLATMITGSYESLRTEAGCIPMTTEWAPDKAGNRVVRAGTRGGAVRASSGYAFLRIQDWAAICANTICAGGGPIAHPREPAWRSAIDRLFLRVLRQQPSRAPSFFMSMGSHLPAKTMVRFLSDDCQLRDFLRVASVLPKRLFLRELLLSLKERQWS